MELLRRVEERTKEKNKASELCTFYLRSLCTKGSACKFSHDCEEGSLQITSGNKRKGKGSKENKAVEKDEIGEVRDICMVCEDCEETFIFTIKNQAYYALKGYERPERCRDCREYRGSKR